ncbi:hypothetical protein [Opitutus terrae]|uniref:Uncharacterized protein n=1 Tax=Opitutus terrae (strain DSM 11246 / JCM 15787 / PB90-1) TaxID=452637 RepID=B1ZUK5_OPITP|nr:hypothetical protein [Opitutus terrae]ACB74048.1 hypothetical protein Oter_0759 [Opitutus terrae PB90-1]
MWSRRFVLPELEHPPADLAKARRSTAGSGPDGRAPTHASAGASRDAGPERHAAFVTLVGDEWERALGVYGAAQRTVTFTRQPDSTHSHYLARDVSVSEGSSWNDGRNFSDRESMLAWAGTITNLLPPDL